MKAIPILLAVTLLFSCRKIEVEGTFKNDALGNFDAVWTEFRDVYALTALKNVDWNQLRTTYRPRLTAQSSAAELYTVLCSMLANLNDNHVHLIAANLPKFMAGSLNQKAAFADAQYSTLDEDIQLFRNNIRNNYFVMLDMQNLIKQGYFTGP